MGIDLNAGDTAWVLVSAALVLLMTPAVALFYGGMVRAKGVLLGLDGQPVLLQVVGRRAHIGPAPAGAGHVGLLVWIAVR